MREDHLIYHLYIKFHKYKTFNIAKRSGKRRRIDAPISPLKIIQSKLNQILQYVYRAKPCVHGFINNKNVVTNARVHLRKKYILNVDIKDFFPSINFGRVRGMFIGHPYNFNKEVATVLAQICCYNNALPQGAPTSPTISNMICSKMDDQLQKIAKKYQCFYTRYADDITFSTHLSRIPERLVKYSEDTGKFEAGLALKDAIESNGFQVNPDKVKLKTQARRQQVTGITVNSKVNVTRKYINQIRAMLHAWDKYGLDLAESEHISRYNKKERNPIKGRISFIRVVKGKIEYLGMVRGTKDNIFLKFYEEYCRLAKIPNRFSISTTPASPKKPLPVPKIITEGKTDWKHIKAALRELKLQGYYGDITLDLTEYENELSAGSAEILQDCQRFARHKNDTMYIFVFDRDENNILQKVMEIGKSYKSWGNNVFSFAIPVPSHRNNNPEVCIEMYYTDEEITRINQNQQRLFLSTEFRENSGRHLSEDLNFTGIHKFKNRSKVSIIENDVFDSNDKNVALPKSKFAEYILYGEDSFNDFNFSEFKLIFDVIEQIIKENSNTSK